jgi:hypothetical protein
MPAADEARRRINPDRLLRFRSARACPHEQYGLLRGTGQCASPRSGRDNEGERKPAEQVTFLYVCGLWFVESDCLDKDSGPGRLCTLREPIMGVKTPGGQVIGLSVNPVKDTNCNYEIMIIGDSCVIRAIPRVKSLVGFATLGSPKQASGNFYCSIDGVDMTRAVKLIEMGFSGDGFRR